MVFLLAANIFLLILSYNPVPLHNQFPFRQVRYGRKRREKGYHKGSEHPGIPL